MGYYQFWLTRNYQTGLFHMDPGTSLMMEKHTPGTMVDVGIYMDLYVFGTRRYAGI